MGAKDSQRERVAEGKDYYDLGRRALERRDFPQCREAMFKALDIFWAAGDERNKQLVLQSISKLFHEARDAEIVFELAGYYGTVMEAAEALGLPT